MDEKSTPEKMAISEKQKEMILKLVTKRQREEESSSSDEIIRKPKEFRFLSGKEGEKKRKNMVMFLNSLLKRQLQQESSSSDEIIRRPNAISFSSCEGVEYEEKTRKEWEDILKRQKDLVSVPDEEELKKKEKQKEMLLNFLSKRQRQEQEFYLSPPEEEEEEEKKRQTYLELRQKAIDNPLSDVPFFPGGGPGSVMPNFAPNFAYRGDQTEDFFQIRRQRPLTEEEIRFMPGRRVNLPSFPPLPWDNSKFVPLNPELIQKIVEQQQLARSNTVSPNVMSRDEKRAKLAAEGRCLDGSYLTPYCKCHVASCSQHSVIEAAYPPEFAPIHLSYQRQIRQSHCFDIDDYRGSSFGASLLLLEPYQGFRGKAELLMELANRAIQEYNEKECNVFKYKVLKIEKVNCLVTTNYQYWITVKVLNLTLGTPTETFQIHGSIRTLMNDDDKVIYCCRPKEEAVVGLPSCNFCFGKLH